MLIRVDYPSSTKCGGIYIYYKVLLPIRVLNISLQEEYMNSELKIPGNMSSFKI